MIELWKARTLAEESARLPPRMTLCNTSAPATPRDCARFTLLAVDGVVGRRFWLFAGGREHASVARRCWTTRV
jgi:hypothetical protein